MTASDNSAGCIRPIMTANALLVLRGIPGAGKSTLANRLKQHCRDKYDESVSICSNDHYWESTGRRFFIGAIDRAISHCANEVREAVRNGSRIIVLDNTSLQEAWFERFVEITRNQRYRVCLVNLLASDDDSYYLGEDGEEYDSEPSACSVDVHFASSAFRCTERCTKNMSYATIVSKVGDYEELDPEDYSDQINIGAPLEWVDGAVDDIICWLENEGVVPRGSGEADDGEHESDESDGSHNPEDGGNESNESDGFQNATEGNDREDDDEKEGEVGTSRKSEQLALEREIKRRKI